MTLYHTCGKAQGLAPSDKLVLQELARCADKKGRTMEGRRSIAAYTGLSERTVSRSLTNLAAMGWIVVECRHSTDGRRRTNVTTIIDPVAEFKKLKASVRLPLFQQQGDLWPEAKVERKQNVESFPFHARRVVK